MSKIYEALLRAEQERIAGTNKPAAEQPDSTPAAVAVAVAPAAAPYVEQASAWHDPSPAATAVAEMPPVQHLPVQHLPVQEPSFRAPLVQEPALSVAEPVVTGSPLVSPLAATAPLDMSAIRATVWTPLLEKLPALEERGNAVEQFRSLRTRLFGFRDLNNLKSILISSGLPREGKSFIAANLAVSFARHKASRVLLIDGDMRRASLHDIFGAEKNPGLTNYLAGHSSITEIMQRAALNDDGSPLFTGLGSLTFIGGGEEGDKAADLSGSGRFRQLIEACSPYFDWIIVDSSPVNLVTDGVNLAAACDAVLMVARGGVTKFEAAQRALAELKSSKILGVVLNAVEAPPTLDGYYGYDGYDALKSSAGQPTQ